MRFTWFLLAVIGLSSPAVAAGVDANAMPKMDAGYRPAFADYRYYRQMEMGDWREANDMAMGMGGHAGHGMNHGDQSGGQDMNDMHKGMPGHSGHGGH